MAIKKAKVRVGGKVKISGQYRAGKGKSEVTLIKGKKAPPNNKGKTETWRLVDKTKHHKIKKSR